jgi:hypothetical protein
MRRRGNVRKLLCRPYLFTGSQESDTRSKSCDSGTALEKPRACKAPAEQLKTTRTFCTTCRFNLGGR